MFERYTEPARRAIFFARYEASQAGSRHMEPQQLLLGILREDARLKERVFGATSIDEVRERFPASGEKIPTSVDLPLSRVSQRVLALAAEEADIAGSRTIGPEHLLAGLLQEDSEASRLVAEQGFDLEACRSEFTGAPAVSAQLSLEHLIGQMPEDRISVAARILQALSGERVTIGVTTPHESFTVEFPEKAE